MPRKEPRDYQKENEQYHGKPGPKKDRAARNKIRRKLGRVGKRDGKEIDHKDGNPRNNSPSNIRIVKRMTNRRKG